MNGIHVNEWYIILALDNYGWQVYHHWLSLMYNTYSNNYMYNENISRYTHAVLKH